MLPDVSSIFGLFINQQRYRRGSLCPYAQVGDDLPLLPQPDLESYEHPAHE